MQSWDQSTYVDSLHQQSPLLTFVQLLKLSKSVIILESSEIGI